MQLIDNIFKHIFVFIIVDRGCLNIGMIYQGLNSCDINTICQKRCYIHSSKNCGMTWCGNPLKTGIKNNLKTEAALKTPLFI